MLKTPVVLQHIFNEDQLRKYDDYISYHHKKYVDKKDDSILENDNIYGLTDAKHKTTRIANELFYTVFEKNKENLIEEDNELYEVVHHSFDIFFGIYDPGHFVEIHTDEECYDPDDDTYEIFTILVYLSTHFRSGKTILYEKNDDDKYILPTRGDCLIFNHTKEHESEVLLKNDGDVQKRFISTTVKVKVMM